MNVPTLPTLPTPCPGNVNEPPLDVAHPLKGEGNVERLFRGVGKVEPA